MAINKNQWLKCMVCGQLVQGFSVCQKESGRKCKGIAMRAPKGTYTGVEVQCVNCGKWYTCPKDKIRITCPDNPECFRNTRGRKYERGSPVHCSAKPKKKDRL